MFKMPQKISIETKNLYSNRMTQSNNFIPKHEKDEKKSFFSCDHTGYFSMKWEREKRNKKLAIVQFEDRMELLSNQNLSFDVLCWHTISFIFIGQVVNRLLIG